MKNLIISFVFLLIITVTLGGCKKTLDLPSNGEPCTKLSSVVQEARASQFKYDNEGRVNTFISNFEPVQISYQNDNKTLILSGTGFNSTFKVDADGGITEVIDVDEKTGETTKTMYTQTKTATGLDVAVVESKYKKNQNIPYTTLKTGKKLLIKNGNVMEQKELNANNVVTSTYSYTYNPSKKNIFKDNPFLSILFGETYLPSENLAISSYLQFQSENIYTIFDYQYDSFGRMILREAFESHNKPNNINEKTTRRTRYEYVCD